MLSFERQLFEGASNIAKLFTVGHILPRRILLTLSVQGLPFETIKFDIDTYDAQSLPDMSALLISVEGYLVVRVFLSIARPRR